MSTPAENPLAAVKVVANALGTHVALKDWQSFRFPGHGTPISSTWVDVFTTPVGVTSGRPSYDIPRGLKINTKQTIASFLGKVFASPIEASLYRDPDENPTAPFKSVASDQISVGKKGKSELIISLMRTIRVPEDSSTYNLPPGLGRFPVFDIRPFSERLPASMVAQGGLFFPMYREF